MQKAKVRVYELIDQKKSGFIRKGTENTANPVELTCAQSTTLSNKSRMYIDKKNGYRDIVYYPGCPTIFVHDYEDADGNKVQGLITQGVDVTKMVNTNRGCIRFLNGKLAFSEDVDDPMLELFLTNSHNYVSGNEEKDSKRPRTAASPLKFTLNKSEKKALVLLSKGDAMVYCMDLYNKMVELVPGKKGERKFATHLLDYYLALLNVSTDSSVSDAEKANLILAYITEDVESFYDVVFSAQNLHGIQYRRGLERKIIRFSESNPNTLQYKLGILDNGDVNWEDVFTSSSTDSEKRDEEAKCWIFGSPTSLSKPQKIKTVLLNLI